MDRELFYNIAKNSLYVIIPLIILPPLMKVIWDECIKKKKNEDQEFEELIKKKTLLFQKKKKK